MDVVCVSGEERTVCVMDDSWPFPFAQREREDLALSLLLRLESVYGITTDGKSRGDDADVLRRTGNTSFASETTRRRFANVLEATSTCECVMLWNGCEAFMK